MIGQTISHYKITAKLGEGGMGEVYLATDTSLDRRVALKFLPAALADDPEARARLLREARAASRLNHPNILTVYAVEEAAGDDFIAMEYVEGRSLRELIQQGDLGFDRVLDIALQIGAGLAAAHEAGVIHRDIKPDNIKVTPTAQVKIMDFGLATWRGATRLTAEGSTVGTVAYASPEQAQGKEIDHRSDIFSFGVVLYEMITRRLPFPGDHEAAITYAIVNEASEPMSRFKAALPAELERIVAKSLAKSPAERYQSIADMAADLKAISRTLTSTQSRSSEQSAQTTPSIAVLPFTNLSADREQEYFCDGITEEIINALTHLEGLRVVARTSAFTFKDKKEDIRTIGRKLNVGTLLEGSVRKSGTRIRITVQLVNVADGYHIWSERYDREMEDIFAIQDGISLAVVEKLKLQFQEGERAKVVKRGTTDLDAYTSYLKGKFLFNQRKGPALKASIEQYQQAIDKDPRFALAYAGLADSYAILGTWRALPPETAFEKARAAVMRALEIDDMLVEAHVSLANVKLFCDWDWDGAEREYRLALAQNPQHAEVHHMYAHLLEIIGRFDPAVSEINRALELEPVSPGVNSCAVEILFYARRYQEAIAQCRRALDVAPHFLGLYGWLGIAYVQSGEVERGTEMLSKGLQLLGDDPKLHALLGYASALSGNMEDANESLDKVLALADRRHVDPYFVAWIHAGLNEKASAFTWLKKACDERSEWVAWLRVDPLLDSLRADPRFHDLLERMRLD